MRLRWKKHEKETGLARACSGPRGSDYTDGTDKYATIQAHRGWGQKIRKGWFFYASVEGVSINTCDTPVATEAEAKVAASAWVKAQLKFQQSASVSAIIETEEQAIEDGVLW